MRGNFLLGIAERRGAHEGHEKEEVESGERRQDEVLYRFNREIIIRASSFLR